MSRHESLVRLRHTLDHSREAVATGAGKKREDLDADRKLNLALVRLLEIVGEAANRTPADERAPSTPTKAAAFIFPLTTRHKGRALPTGSTGSGIALRIPPVDLWTTRLKILDRRCRWAKMIFEQTMTSHSQKGTGGPSPSPLPVVLVRFSVDREV